MEGFRQFLRLIGQAERLRYTADSLDFRSTSSPEENMMKQSFVARLSVLLASVLVTGFVFETVASLGQSNAQCVTQVTWAHRSDLSGKPAGA